MFADPEEVVIIVGSVFGFQGAYSCCGFDYSVLDRAGHAYGVRSERRPEPGEWLTLIKLSQSTCGKRHSYIWRDDVTCTYKIRIPS